MKTIGVKMIIIAMFVMVGNLSLSAQIRRGGSCLCGTTTTTVVERPLTCPTVQLTDEQKIILNDLYVIFQAEMAELRSAMRSTFVWADKLLIRQQMVDLRNAHLAEVKALMEEWGY